MNLKTAMVASLAWFSTAAIAEPAITVQSLLKDGFNIAGTVASPAGPGLFLQKDDQLYLCIVTETRRNRAR
jgi:hypothetical protein